MNPPRSTVSILGFLLTACLAALAAQNGGNGNHHGWNNSVKVSISPSSATLQVGQSRQFSASVSGTSNANVSWLVNGVKGGNSTAGTISTSGLYTAPAASASMSATITAQSAAQPSASASASVTITPSVSVSISISPVSTSLQVGQSQQFAAAVSGTSNTAVNWIVNGILGGNSAVGTISSSGMYSAPASVPSTSVTVTAQSAAQTSVSVSAAVSITPALVSLSVSPANASVEVGQSQQFSAVVSNTTNTAVNWLVSGILGGNSSVGTITTTGLYTAPSTAPGGLVAVTARSSTYPTDSASAIVTITQPPTHYVSLAWSPVPSVAGYNVYRSAQATGPFTRINSSVETATVYADNSVTSGQTYYYATTAVSSTGTESPYSNIAQAMIP